MSKQRILKAGASGPVDPASLDRTDLAEASYMAEASATLLRQSFGIVVMFNSLQEHPMSDDELKNFAKEFDLVHNTVRSIAAGIRKFVATMPAKEVASHGN